MIVFATAIALQLPALHKFWQDLPPTRNTVVLICSDTPPCHKEFAESRKLALDNPDMNVITLDFAGNRRLVREMMVEDVPTVLVFAGKRLVHRDNHIDQLDITMAIVNRGRHTKGKSND